MLKCNAPSSLKLIMITKVSEEVLRSGNRNDAPSLEILHKISSENTTKLDLHKEFHEFMIRLISQFEKSWPGHHCIGYIQCYSVKPFYITLFTEKQIKYLLSLKGPIFCYLDATGSIVAKPPNVSKQIYYYAMVLPGCENYTAIPVAEFISSEHKTVFINFFLSLFRDNMNQITSRHPVIDKIETDFSLGLIQSALQTFNGMSISKYMQFVYNWNSKKEGADDIHLTAVHICATHTLRTVMKKAKSLFKLKSARNVAAFLISKLIHCDNFSALFLPNH